MQVDSSIQFAGTQNGQTVTVLAPTPLVVFVVESGAVAFRKDLNHPATAVGGICCGTAWARSNVLLNHGRFSQIVDASQAHYLCRRVTNELCRVCLPAAHR